MNEEELNCIDLDRFVRLPDTVSLQLRQTDKIEELIQNIPPYMCMGKVLQGGILIVYVSRNGLDEVMKYLGSARIEIFSVTMGLLGEAELEAAGIIPVQMQPYLDLNGQGVLIGFVDTGIDYTNPAFIFEDGTSKVRYLWDQTVEGGIPPEGFYFGNEYSNEQINAALQSDNPLEIVPETDTVGHGTFLASVAAGRETEGNWGAAPDSELIVVKLKTANQFYRDRDLVPASQENVYEDADVMLGIEYLVDKAIELKKPISICLGIGSNTGGHDGFNPIEEYLSTISNLPGVCVCTAAGNEAQAGHHTMGKLEMTGDRKTIEVKVPENAESFPVLILNNPSDRITVSVTSPTGEVVGPIPAKTGTSLEAKLVLEVSTVIIEYFFPILGSGSQVEVIKILDPTPGIWTITVVGEIVLDGVYHAWLPITGFVTPGIEFTAPNPNYTIVVPSTAVGSITCGAYNSSNNSIYVDSSQGPTRAPMMSPDLVAPGVNVRGVYPMGSGTMTGTSVATAITAGACALMLQWGIVDGHDITFNTYRIRTQLIRGCSREPNIQYPSLQWGYGKLNLINTFTQLR